MTKERFEYYARQQGIREGIAQGFTQGIQQQKAEDERLLLAEQKRSAQKDAEIAELKRKLKEMSQMNL